MLRTTWTVMNQWKRALAVALIVSAWLGWGGAVARAADAITDDNVNQAISAAKTPEDHQALAAYFTSKAEAALANAKKHDDMAKSFAPSKSMAAHCAALAANDRRQAKEYTAMAKAQDRLAKGKSAQKTHAKHGMSKS